MRNGSATRTAAAWVASWATTPDGSTRGLATNRFGYTGSFYEVTFGANYKRSANITIRPYVRFDWFSGDSPAANLRPFDDGFGNSQTLVGLRRGDVVLVALGPNQRTRDDSAESNSGVRWQHAPRLFYFDRLVFSGSSCRSCRSNGYTVLRQIGSAAGCIEALRPVIRR